MRKSEENTNNNINITNNDNNNDTTKTRIIAANGENDNNNNIVKASGNANKKRVLKEEDKYDEDRESDEPQKKPRVVWSPDLHRKFVEAIHELGMDKAVPKKILEKMGVHDLTRENIASHLQKYRLYLKRLKEMPIQQANLLQSGFGSRNSQYTHLSSLESFKNYHASSRYRQYVPLSSFGYGTNRSCAMSASSLPPLVASSIPSGYGTSVSNNNNGILGSNYNNINSINNVNNVNNQTNLFMAGTATSTYSFQYLQTQCTNNGINYNYSSLPVPPAAQITNLPFAGSNISPIVMNTNGNLTGQNYTSETGDELQQVIASFNNSMQNFNHNTSALNSNLASALFNPITKMNNSYVSVATNGEMGFGTSDGNGTGNFVPDQLSTSNNGSGFDSVDDLLAILKPMDGSGDVLFMDDILANLDV